jgi:hypothetical protein
MGFQVPVVKGASLGQAGPGIRPLRHRPDPRLRSHPPQKWQVSLAYSEHMVLPQEPRQQLEES